MDKEKLGNGENVVINRSKIIEATRAISILCGMLWVTEGFVNKGLADMIAGLVVVGIAAIAPSVPKFKK